MARVRYLGPEPVTVPELGDERIVHPDEIVEIPDERYWGYACQTENWEEIEPPADFTPPGAEPPADETEEAPAAEQQAAEPAPAKALAKKTAAKLQKGD